MRTERLHYCDAYCDVRFRTQNNNLVLSEKVDCLDVVTLHSTKKLRALQNINNRNYSKLYSVTEDDKNTDNY